MILIAVVAVMTIHALYCYSFSDSRLALAFSCVSVIVVAFAYLLIRALESRVRHRVEMAFLVGLISCGLLYSVVFAPGTVPDETYHFEASYKLADYIMLQGPTVDSLPVRADDSALLDGMLQSWALGYDKYRSVIDQFAFFVNDASRVAVEPVSSFDWTANPPYIKLPSALGIVLATLLNLGSYPLFYLGRFFNLLMFAALAYFAVRITPVGKNAMMVAGLLPMTLHLASSYSYDAGIMGLAFLLTGMCLRAVYGEGLMSRREKAGIVVVAVLLAPCKVVYTVIVLLVILIPRKRFSSTAASARFKAIAIGCALLSVLVFRAAGLLQMAGVASSSTAEGSRGDEYGTFYSLSGLVSDPLNTVLLFLRTFDVQGSFYLDTLVGGSLAWFQVDLKAPLYITVALLFIVVLSAQRSEGDNAVIPGAHRVLCGGLALAGGLGVILSMLIGWTFTSESVVQGVQGRYFLPLLPMAALIIRSKHMSIDIPLGMGFVYIMIAVNAMYLARTFSVAVGV
ncbi:MULTISPECIES: DUF2142 domain-containing protein [Eggerthella]|uniref:DUF2142 domain-containing protein n=1 Tax=Eggerthella TaxID=84111 RepID=UPI001E5A5BDE|nr:MULTISPECIES: DUF2142 domain-containing protein [Eggerthella]MCQ4798820.1 DUF2142 domain-containing protein [Eggerthella lenta]MDB1807373.1 DUF2142 domain-containing protein [Eggerthella lenta]MDU5065995.1 DUF2142 domain-containing protein [Eggerthella sp.]